DAQDRREDEEHDAQFHEGEGPQAGGLVYQPAGVGGERPRLHLLHRDAAVDERPDQPGDHHRQAGDDPDPEDPARGVLDGQAPLIPPIRACRDDRGPVHLPPPPANQPRMPLLRTTIRGPMAASATEKTRRTESFDIRSISLVPKKAPSSTPVATGTTTNGSTRPRCR